MHVAEVQRAITLLTQLIETAAQKVVDCKSGHTAPDGKPFEELAYTARSSLVAANPATLEQQIDALVGKLQTDLQAMFKGPSVVYWRSRPEIIYGANTVRIRCRVRITPSIALVKTAPLVAQATA